MNRRQWLREWIVYSRAMWRTFSPPQRRRWIRARWRVVKLAPLYAKLMPTSELEMASVAQGVFAPRTLREATL